MGETGDPELCGELRLETGEQLKAIGNLSRHRILNLLAEGSATITQVAARLGLQKGSASYHVRLLERAGMVRVVSTRKVRGVTERYYAPVAKTLVLPKPAPGEPDVLLRHALADLEATPVPDERRVLLTQARLTSEQFAEFVQRVHELAAELRAEQMPGAPMASLAIALFRPPEPARGQGDAEQTERAEQTARQTEQTEQTERTGNRMTHSTALVPTERPGRYIKQLVSHMSHKSTTELTEDGGVITVRAGSCVLTEKPEGILMEATAEDTESLLAVQDVVARHLVRFATQEELVVDWSEPQA